MCLRISIVTRVIRMLSNPEQVARRLAAVGARRGHTPPALSHTHKHTHERSTIVTHIQSLCTVCFLYYLRVEETYRNTPASVTLYLVPINTSTHTHTHPIGCFLRGERPLWESTCQHFLSSPPWPPPACVGRTDTLISRSSLDALNR